MVTGGASRRSKRVRMTSSSVPSSRTRRAPVVFGLLVGVLGTVILLWLGVWQLQRLDWKEGILADIADRMASAPVALPDDPDPVRDRYLPVRISGEVGEPDVLVQASLKRVGPGYRVIAPFTTEDGRRILIDRGFLRAANKTDPRAPLAMTVEGNLHWPDEVDGFTPDPDPNAGLWFARDVPSLAAHLDTEPVLLVARATSAEQPGIVPLPVDTAGISNNHLQYAVTWFGLALVWAVMTGYFLRARLRGSA